MPEGARAARCLRLRGWERLRSATWGDLPPDEGLAQGRRDGSGVLGIADRPHHTEPRRSGLDHLGRPCGVDPPDRVEGKSGLAGGESAYAGAPGDYYWGGAGGTYFWVDPRTNLFVVFMMQSPKQRVYYRGVVRDMVYAAVER